MKIMTFRKERPRETGRVRFTLWTSDEESANTSWSWRVIKMYAWYNCKDKTIEYGEF